MLHINEQYIENRILPYLVNDVSKNHMFARKLYQLEAESQIFFEHSTYDSTIYRHNEYKIDEEREKLRSRIVNELISYNFIDDEESIQLGIGGCKPNNIDRNTFYQVIGLPGSGKSYISHIIANVTGAYIIDSDYAKRKFPEYSMYTCASSVLHKEANEIVHNLFGESVFYHCIKNRYSMISPRIGNVYQELDNYIKMIKDNNYQVYLILVDMKPSDSIKSCYDRFCKTGRYIPLTKIESEYGILPNINYQKMKNSELLSGYTLIQTSLDRKYKIIEQSTK